MENGMQTHVKYMTKVNDLADEERSFISNKFKNTLPLLAKNSESALLCHLQHILEHNDIIKPGINVYCMYVLEKYHYENKENGFIANLIDSV